MTPEEREALVWRMPTQHLEGVFTYELAANYVTVDLHFYQLSLHFHPSSSR